jgi:hypothetical protein
LDYYTYWCYAWWFFFCWCFWSLCFATDGRDHGDVVTGTISVDSFDAHTLFNFGASFSFVSDAFVARAHLFR